MSYIDKQIMLPFCTTNLARIRNLLQSFPMMITMAVQWIDTLIFVVSIHAFPTLSSFNNSKIFKYLIV